MHILGHANHTHGMAHPRDLQVGRGLLWKLFWGPGYVGCAQRQTLPRGCPPYPGGGVWGRKVARPPGEAVVAGALARAHALERHLRSSGSIPYGWSTNEGLWRCWPSPCQLVGPLHTGRPPLASPPQGTLQSLSTTNPNKGRSMRAKSLPLPPVPGVHRPEERRRPWVQAGS